MTTEEAQQLQDMQELASSELDTAKSNEWMDNFQKKIEENRKKQSRTPLENYIYQQEQFDRKQALSKDLIGENNRYQKELADNNYTWANYANQQQYINANQRTMDSELLTDGRGSYIPEDVRQAMIVTGKVPTVAEARLNQWKRDNSYIDNYNKNLNALNQAYDKIDIGTKHQLNQLDIKRSHFEQENLDSYNRFKSLKAMDEYTTNLVIDDINKFVQKYDIAFNPTEYKNWHNNEWRSFGGGIVEGFIDELIGGIPSLFTSNKWATNPVQSLLEALGIMDKNSEYIDTYKSEIYNSFIDDYLSFSAMKKAVVANAGYTVGLFLTSLVPYIGQAGKLKYVSKVKNLAMSGKFKKELGKINELARKSQAEGKLNEARTLSFLSQGLGKIGEVAEKVAKSIALQAPFRAGSRISDIATQRLALEGKEYTGIGDLTARDVAMGSLSMAADAVPIPAALLGGGLINKAAIKALEKSTRKSTKALALGSAGLGLGAIGFATEGVTEAISTISELSGVYGVDLDDVIATLASDDPKDAEMKFAIMQSFAIGGIMGGGIAGVGNMINAVATAKENLLKANADRKTIQGRENEHTKYREELNANIDKAYTSKEDAPNVKDIKDTSDNINTTFKNAKQHFDIMIKQEEAKIEQAKSAKEKNEATAKINTIDAQRKGVVASEYLLNKYLNKLIGKGETSARVAETVKKIKEHIEQSGQNFSFENFVKGLNEIDGGSDTISEVLREFSAAYRGEEKQETQQQAQQADTTTKQEESGEIDTEAQESSSQMEDMQNAETATEEAYEIDESKGEAKNKLSFTGRYASKTTASKQTPQQQAKAKQEAERKQKLQRAEEDIHKAIMDGLDLKDTSSQTNDKLRQLAHMIDAYLDKNQKAKDKASKGLIEAALISALKLKNSALPPNEITDADLESLAKEYIVRDLDSKTPEEKQAILDYLAPIIRNQEIKFKHEINEDIKEAAEIVEEINKLEKELSNIMEDMTKGEKIDRNRVREIRRSIDRFTHRLSKKYEKYQAYDENIDNNPLKNEILVAQYFLGDVAKMLHSMTQSLDIFTQKMETYSKNFDQFKKEFEQVQKDNYKLGGDNAEKRRFYDLFTAIISTFKSSFNRFLDKFVAFYNNSGDMNPDDMRKMLTDINDNFSNLKKPLNRLKSITEEIISKYGNLSDLANATFIRDNISSTIGNAMDINYIAYANNLLYASTLANFIDFSIDPSNDKNLTKTLSQMIANLLNHKPFVDDKPYKSKGGKDSYEYKQAVKLAQAEHRQQIMEGFVRYFLPATVFAELKPDINTKEYNVNDIYDALNKSGRMNLISEFMKALTSSFFLSFHNEMSRAKEGHFDGIDIFDNIGVQEALLATFIDFTGIKNDSNKVKRNENGGIVSINGIDATTFSNDLYGIVTTFLQLEENKKANPFFMISTSPTVVNGVNKLYRYYQENKERLDGVDIKEGNVLYEFLGKFCEDSGYETNNGWFNLFYGSGMSSDNFKNKDGKNLQSEVLFEALKAFREGDIKKAITLFDKYVPKNTTSENRNKFYLMFKDKEDGASKLLQNINNIERAAEKERNSNKAIIREKPEKEKEGQSENISRHNDRVYGISETAYDYMNDTFGLGDLVDSDFKWDFSKSEEENLQGTNMISISDYKVRRRLREGNLNGLDVDTVVYDDGETNILYYVPIFARRQLTDKNGKAIEGRSVKELVAYAPLKVKKDENGKVSKETIEAIERKLEALGVKINRNATFMGGNKYLRDNLPDLRDLGEFLFLHSLGKDFTFHYNWDEQESSRTGITDSAFALSNKLVRNYVVLKEEGRDKDGREKNIERTKLKEPTSFKDIEEFHKDKNGNTQTTDEFNSITLALLLKFKNSQELKLNIYEYEDENGETQITYSWGTKDDINEFKTITRALIEYAKGNKSYSEILDSLDNKLKPIMDEVVNAYEQDNIGDLRDTEGALDALNIKKISRWLRNPEMFNKHELLTEIDGSATGIAEASLNMDTNRQDVQEGMGIYRYFITDLGLMLATKNEVATEKKFKQKDEKDITDEDILAVLEKDPAYGKAVANLRNAMKGLEDMPSIFIKALANMFVKQDGELSSDFFKRLRNDIGKTLLTPTSYGASQSSIVRSEDAGNLSRMVFDTLAVELNNVIGEVLKDQVDTSLPAVWDAVLNAAVNKHSGIQMSDALRHMLTTINKDYKGVTNLIKSQNSRSIYNNNIFDIILSEVFFGKREKAAAEAIGTVIDFSLVSKSDRLKLNSARDIAQMSLNYNTFLNRAFPIIFGEGEIDHLTPLNHKKEKLAIIKNNLYGKQSNKLTYRGESNLLEQNGKPTKLFKDLLFAYGISLKNKEGENKTNAQLRIELGRKINSSLDYAYALLANSNTEIYNVNQMKQGLSYKALAPFASTINMRFNATQVVLNYGLANTMTEIAYQEFRKLIQHSNEDKIAFTSLLDEKNEQLKDSNGNLLQLTDNTINLINKKANFIIQKEATISSKNRMDTLQKSILSVIDDLSQSKKEEDRLQAVILAALYNRAISNTRQVINKYLNSKIGNVSNRKTQQGTKNSLSTKNFVKQAGLGFLASSVIHNVHTNEKGYIKVQSSESLKALTENIPNVVPLVEHAVEADVARSVNLSDEIIAQASVFDAFFTSLHTMDQASNVWEQGFSFEKLNNSIFDLFNLSVETLKHQDKFLKDEYGDAITIRFPLDENGNKVDKLAATTTSDIKQEVGNYLAFMAKQIDYVSELNPNMIITEGTKVTTAGTKFEIGSKTIHAFGQTGENIEKSGKYKSFVENIKWLDNHNFVKTGWYKKGDKKKKTEAEHTITQQGQVVKNSFLASDRLAAKLVASEESARESERSGLKDRLNAGLFFLKKNIAINTSGMKLNDFLGNEDLSLNELPTNENEKKSKENAQKEFKNYKVTTTESNTEESLLDNTRNNANAVISINRDTSQITTSKNKNVSNGVLLLDFSNANTNNTARAMYDSMVSFIEECARDGIQLNKFVFIESSNNTANRLFKSLTAINRKLTGYTVYDYANVSNALNGAIKGSIKEEYGENVSVELKTQQQLTNKTLETKTEWIDNPIDSFANELIAINNPKNNLKWYQEQLQDERLTTIEEGKKAMKANLFIRLWGFFNTGESGNLSVLPVTILPETIFSQEIIDSLEKNGCLDEMLDLFGSALHDNPSPKYGYDVSRNLINLKKYGSQSSNNVPRTRSAAGKSESLEEIDDILNSIESTNTETDSSNAYNEYQGNETTLYDENGEPVIDNSQKAEFGRNPALEAQQQQQAYNASNTVAFNDEGQVKKPNTPPDDHKKKQKIRLLDKEGKQASDAKLETILADNATHEIDRQSVFGQISSFLNTIRNKEVYDMVSKLFEALKKNMNNNVVFIVARDSLMGESAGFTKWKDGKVYVVISKSELDNRTNTIAHEFIHAALYETDLITNSLGITNIQNDIKNLQSKVLRLIEQDENLMKRLGFMNEDGSLTALFKAIASDYQEFIAYFLTETDKLEYIASLSAKAIRSQTGNNSYVVRLFNLIKSIITKTIEALTMGKFIRENPSMVYLLTNSVEKLSKYNNPTKAYKLDNSLWNKSLNHLDTMSNNILVHLPLLNQLESIKHYMARNNITQQDYDKITESIMQEWNNAEYNHPFDKFVKVLTSALFKTPIHREVALEMFNMFLRDHSNIITNEISGILQSIKVLSPNNLYELEKIAGRKTALDQMKAVYNTSQKKIYDELYTNAIGEETAKELALEDEKWSAEDYVEDEVNDFYRMKRFSPTKQLERAITGIFDTGIFTSTNSVWLRENNQELYPALVDLFVNGSLEDTDKVIKDMKNEILNEVVKIIKSNKKYASKVKSRTSINENLIRYFDALTDDLGFSRIAGGKSQKGLQNVSEMLKGLYAYDNVRLTNHNNDSDLALQDLYNVLFHALKDSSDNSKAAKIYLRNLMSQLHTLTTLKAIRHTKNENYEGKLEGTTEMYEIFTGYYREKIKHIKEKISDDKMDSFIQNICGLGLLQNNLLISSKIREMYSPTDNFADIIELEMQMDELAANPTKENMEKYNELSKQVEELEAPYERLAQEFMQYDFTKDYSADNFTPYQMNPDIATIELHKINENEEQEVTAKIVEEYYQAKTKNKNIKSFKDAANYILGLGYEVVDEWGMTHKIEEIGDIEKFLSDRNMRKLTFKYSGKEVNRDSLTQFTLIGESFENKGNDINYNIAYNQNQMEAIMERSMIEKARAYTSIFFDHTDDKLIQSIGNKLYGFGDTTSDKSSGESKSKTKKRVFVEPKKEANSFDYVVAQYFKSNQDYRAIAGSNTKFRTQMNRIAFENLTDVDTSIISSMVELSSIVYKQKNTDMLNKDLIKSIIKDNIKMRKNGKNLTSDTKGYVKIYDLEYENKGLSKAGKIQAQTKLGMEVRLPENVITQIGRLLKTYNLDKSKESLTTLYVPIDIANLIAGVETKTIATLFGSFIKDPKVIKMLNWLGYRGQQFLNDTKSNIIIRNPEVLLKNFTSSVMSLTALGMDPAQIAQSVPSTIKAIMNYQADVEEILSLTTQRDALIEGGAKDGDIELNNLNIKIEALAKRIEDNFVSYPMSMGADTNIINETIGDISYTTELYRKGLKKATDLLLGDKKQVFGRVLENRFGLTWDKINEEIIMSTESDLYKMAVTINRLGDIAPRIIAYQHYLREGYTQEEAYMRAKDAYIDYITPLESQLLRNIEGYGVLPFLRFVLRAIPAFVKNFADRPASTSVSILSTGVLETLMPDIMGLSIYGEFFNFGNKVTRPFKTVFNPENIIRHGWLFN